MPYASVYPLVTARAVAREFTYEVPEGVAVGAIVRVPFGRSRARGIVVSLHDAAPDGVDARPIESVIGEIPATLVELALWIADYYGSTPARALALVAPETPKRRKEQAPPAERQGLTGEAEPLQLSDSQIAAVDRIVNGEGNYLLYGATGSGKTEVYLQACASMLERGLGAIVLVPEIALAPQTVGRVRARFGDRVAILHSALTDAERRDERARIASGEARIVVGARSAIFAPIRGLGLIVVDEEHDPSYKQDSDPRYDARTVAAKRAALEGAVAVFGSATPRPESWAALERLELGGRLGADLPPVQVIDLRREAGYPLSAPLLRALRGVAERRRQGDPASESPRGCARAPLPRVRNDDPVPELRRLARPARRHVPSLPSLRLRAAGAVDVRGVRLAGARAVGRRDAEARAGARARAAGARADPARRRRRREAGAAREVAGALPRREGAVLLGTQMVAKGHHFAGVELAAVVDADTGLGMPDFRAEERTFQLITQLAGRSGRDAPGRVLVQSFQPDARPIVYAARHDVARFLTEELERRKELGYPPFSHLVRIVVAGPELEPVVRALDELKAGITGADLLGPAALLRLRGKYRAQLVAKTTQPRRIASQAARLLAAAAPNMRKAKLTAVVDVDPQSL